MKRILLTVLLVVCLAVAFLAPRIALTARADAIRESVSTAQPLTIQDSTESVIKRLILLADMDFNTKMINYPSMLTDQTELLEAFQAEMLKLYELGAITGTMCSSFDSLELTEYVERRLLLDLNSGESAQVYVINTIYGDYAVYDQACGKILALYWTHDSEPMRWESQQLKDVSQEDNYRLQLSAWAEYFSLENYGDLYFNSDAAPDFASGGSVLIAGGFLTDGETSVGLALENRQSVDGLAWEPVPMECLLDSTLPPVPAEAVEKAESADAIAAGE